MSNLSTYLIGALAAFLVLDHAPTAAFLWPSLNSLSLPAELADPAGSVDRARKGDRWLPDRLQYESKPANAPLEVVDFPTGSTGGYRSVRPSTSPIDNVTAVTKGAAPGRAQPQVGRPLPAGCESAFGRLVAPPLAYVPGHCVI